MSEVGTCGWSRRDVSVHKRRGGAMTERADAGIATGTFSETITGSPCVAGQVVQMVVVQEFKV